jgi:hypothetical protein
MVVLTLGRETPASGAMFVNGAGKDIPDTVQDLLNSEDPFLPFERADGMTVLISRQNLKWVRTEVPAGNGQGPVSGVVREELVQVRFADGESITGFLVLELESASGRASDFVNGTRQFFGLNTPAGLFLINRNLVLDITVFETSPSPALPDFRTRREAGTPR